MQAIDVVDAAWSQPSMKALVTALVAIPPDQADEIGKVVFRLLDTSGKTTAEHPAQVNTLNAEGRFFRAEARWPTDEAAPGAYLPLGIVYDREGNARQRRASEPTRNFLLAPVLRSGRVPVGIEKCRMG